MNNRIPTARALHTPIPLVACVACAACAFVACLVLSCSVQPARSGRITVMAYNAGNLFDAVLDGTEYDEYKPKSGRWDAARYEERLGRLAAVILAAEKGGPDVVALSEIENGRVLADLAARPELAASGYRWKLAAPDENSAVRCCILSRLPVLSARSHQAERSGGSGRLRLMLEAELDSGGAPLRLLVAHWKSKTEGAEETEPDRIAQARAVAALVASRMAVDPGVEFLLVGDLNENPDEYARVGGRYPTALAPHTATRPRGGRERAPGLLVAEKRADAGVDADGVALWSPWFETDGYSFRYRGEDERIDHALLAPGLLDAEGLAFRRFRVVAADFLVDDEGTPLAYDPRTRAGYSDHLPIVVELELRGAGAPSVVEAAAKKAAP